VEKAASPECPPEQEELYTKRGEEQMGEYPGIEKEEEGGKSDSQRGMQESPVLVPVISPQTYPENEGEGKVDGVAKQVAKEGQEKPDPLRHLPEMKDRCIRGIHIRSKRTDKSGRTDSHPPERGDSREKRKDENQQGEKTQDEMVLPLHPAPP
jgi:hypothetical protein